jgi:hypothetical protein
MSDDEHVHRCPNCGRTPVECAGCDWPQDLISKQRAAIQVQQELIASLKKSIESYEDLVAELKRLNAALEREVSLEQQVAKRYKDVVDEYKRMDPLFGVGVGR